MFAVPVAIGVIFALQTLLGILGNSFLLFHYVPPCLTGCRQRPTDVILKHMTIANTMVILCRGVTQTMAALGVRDFLDDVGCKLVFYLHRVGRGVSMGTTCLLSVFQMVTISPWTSKWAQHKERVSENTEYYVMVIWLLSLSVNLMVATSMHRNVNNKTITMEKFLGYCTATFINEVSPSFYIVLLSLPDVLCLGLMLWASGSMVSMLYRHKQQVQHLHRAHVTPRAAPETRATHRILVLVSTFVTFYTLSSICHLYIALSDNPSWWQVTLSVLCAASFPTVSPLLLRSHHSRLSGLCCVYARNTSPQNVIRDL